MLMATPSSSSALRMSRLRSVACSVLSVISSSSAAAGKPVSASTDLTMATKSCCETGVPKH
jgi:hypothetical protein